MIHSQKDTDKMAAARKVRMEGAKTPLIVNEAKEAAVADALKRKDKEAKEAKEQK